MKKHKHRKDLVCERWCCWQCLCGYGGSFGHKLWLREMVTTENPYGGVEPSKMRSEQKNNKSCPKKADN